MNVAPVHFGGAAGAAIQTANALLFRARLKLCRNIGGKRWPRRSCAVSLGGIAHVHERDAVVMTGRGGARRDELCEGDRVAAKTVIHFTA